MKNFIGEFLEEVCMVMEWNKVEDVRLDIVSDIAYNIYEQTGDTRLFMAGEYIDEMILLAP